MKKLIVFLLLVCNLKTFATHFTFGTVGSTASLTSMSGHSMGDTGYIASGNYTILSVQNLDSIHVLALDQNNPPVFSQTSGVWGNRWCEIGYLKFVWVSGSSIGWQMNGARSAHNNYHDLSFYGFASSVFTMHNNFAYTYGDHTTSVSDQDTWHDIIIDSCGQFFQGSFWNSTSNVNLPTDFITGATFYNIQDIATSLCCGNGQGTGIRGCFGELTVHDCKITDRSGRGADGDVGWIYLNWGSVHMWNVVKWGGPGALLRNNNPQNEVGHPWANEVRNCGKFSGTQYGGLTVNSVYTDTIAGTTFIPDAYFENFTMGNQINDTNNYESSAVLCGQGRHNFCRNIFGFNIGNNTQKAGRGPNNNVPPLIASLCGNCWVGLATDTTHNQYYNYGTLAKIDSITTFYTNRIGTFAAYSLTSSSPSTLLHGGTTGQITTTAPDLFGDYPRSPPDVGYLQLVGPATTMSFSTIPFSNPDIIGPNRGAEMWGGQQEINNPSEAAPQTAQDYYFRFCWADIENLNTDQFNFAYFDSKILSAANAGQKANIGIFALYPGGYTGSVSNATGTQAITAGGFGLSYPLSLHTALQANPAATQDYACDNGGNYPCYHSWMLNYNATQVRTRFNHLKDTVIYHLKHTTYNGKNGWDIVGDWEVRDFGNTGEWTSFNASHLYGGPSTIVADTATIKNFVSDAIARVPDKRLFVPVGGFLGSSIGDAAVPSVTSYWIMQQSNNVGKIGIRRDCFGQVAAFNSSFYESNTSTYNGFNFSDLFNYGYQTRPWKNEPCNSGTWTTPGDESTLNFDMPRQARLYHIASVGNGNMYLGNNVGAALTTVKDSFRLAAKLSGYRLLLNGGSSTTALSTGGPIQITLNWRNVGLTPVYENWNVLYQLRDGTNSVIWQGTSHFNPNLYLPDVVDSVVVDNFTLNTGSPGSGYSLVLIIKDPNGYRSPLPLAVTGANPDGSYTLRSNITVTSTGAPVANAGQSQTITLPTSSITLNGGGSSGTITDYTWSKISGPNSPTISTPNNFQTSVSGLVMGTYIFQLSLNSGASVDTMTVTVNQATPPAQNIFTTQVPSGGTGNDNGGATGIETGVKFRSTVAGYIIGVRFYKTSGNTGTHIGELYNLAGTRLAQATYTNETATGWQTVGFATPIPIAANTTYVAGYFSSAGNYTTNNNYFTTAVTNTNLIGLADGTDGNNGLYKYTATPALPDATFQKANYWVDIIFSIASPNTIIHRKGFKIYFTGP